MKRIIFGLIFGTLTLLPLSSESKPQQIHIVSANTLEGTVTETNEVLFQLYECAIIHQVEHTSGPPKPTIMIRFEVKQECDFTTFDFLPPVSHEQRTPAEWRRLAEKLKREIHQ